MNTEQFYGQLDLLLRENNREKIQLFLQAALEQAKEENNYSTYLAVGNEMIGFYRDISAFRQAFDIAEDVLLLMEELQLEGSEHFAMALLNTASAYRMAGNIKQAYSYHVQALKIYESLLEPGDSQFVPLYCNMSSLLEQMEENENAITLLRRALEIVKTLQGHGKEQAELLTALAMLCFKTGRTKEAKDLFHEAILRYEDMEEKKDIHYSAALAGIGETYFLEKEYENSLIYYEKAASEVKNHFGETQSYAVLLENCAAACIRMERTDKAQDYQNQANRIKNGES